MTPMFGNTEKEQKEGTPTVNVVAIIFEMNDPNAQAIKDELQQMQAIHNMTNIDGMTGVVVYCLGEEKAIELAGKYHPKLFMNAIFNAATDTATYRMFQKSGSNADYILMFEGESDCTDFPEWMELANINTKLFTIQ